MSSLATFQSAVKEIESKGEEGFYPCANLIGYEAALCLLIAHLRNKIIEEGMISADTRDTYVAEYLRAKYRDMMEYLEPPHALFYTPKHYVYDSFAAFTVFYMDRLWKTREHAYQARKFDDPTIIERIFNAGSPYEAKAITREPEVAVKIRKDWDLIKDSVMEKLIELQIDQHEIIKRKLLRTKGLILIEDSPNDGYWGRGWKWKGLDRLGRLWMKARDRRLGLTEGNA